MASAGFYHRPFDGSIDNVCCFMCNKNLDGWEPTDEAWKEHVKHAPFCPLVRLDTEAGRLATFTSESWPHWKKPCLSAGKMARAGLFYWPKLIPTKTLQEDTCVCFQCGLALDGWEDEDDPKQEHAKRRPECPFVKSGVGIRPCSFEFLLASKPDQNAVTHISARPQQKLTDKKFNMPQLPTISKKQSTTRRRDTIIKQSPKRDPSIIPVKTPLRRGTTSTKSASTSDTILRETPRRSRRQTAVRVRALTIFETKDDSALPKGLEHILTRDDLDTKLDTLLDRLVSKKLEHFDLKSAELLSRLNDKITLM